MRGVIAVFVKTPGLSPVKTRLAAHLGKENAEAFHLLSSQCVEQAINKACAGNNSVQGYFAVAEQSALEHPYWHNLPTIWQGEGGLGERMAHIYQSLLNQHDFVILVGADIPQMTEIDLVQAVSYLADSHHKANRFAFGPSDDGGFWLIGGHCDIPEQIWTDVVYSQNDTATQFLNGLDRIGEINTVATQRDVDEIEDLFLLQKTLIQMQRPLPAQQLMMSFLEKVL